MVNFSKKPPAGPFESPTWTPMTEELWRSLRLAPTIPAESERHQLMTPLSKQFEWPDAAI
jgi:hypothetical protein